MPRMCPMSLFPASPGVPPETGSAASRRLNPSPGSWTPRTLLLLDREDPDDAALRDVLWPTQQVADERLLAGRVDAPAGLDGHVLDAVDREGRGRGDDAAVGLELPQLVTGPRVVGAELAVVGTAREHQVAGRAQDRTPHHRLRVEGGPVLL